jgi:hypothetical protein
MRVFAGSFEMGGRRLRVAAVTLLMILAADPAAAQTNPPDFDAVAWTAIGCPAADLVVHAAPAGVDLAGDAAFSAVYVAYDADYAYFRYRLDGDPSGPGGFSQYAWTALMQVPSGDAFQYQYQISLNGMNDSIEIWANTVASPIEFSPLFQDESEVLLFTQPYDLTGPLARTSVAGDGSSFGGDPDYFLDFAVPVAALVAHNVVANANDLAGAYYFPATSTNANNYNKSSLNCPFLPSTALSLDATVVPSLLPANAVSPLAYTITLHNTGDAPARGVVVTGSALPAYMAGAGVAVSSDHPMVTWTVTAVDPLEVRVPALPIGASLSVVLSAEASAVCGSPAFVDHVVAFASNALEVTADAGVTVGASGSETCDGNDNDCDGEVDEGGAVLCDDANSCTVDVCTAGSCTATPVAGCEACATAVACDDGDACTTDTCTASGVCDHQAQAGCQACAVDADCADADACTTEQCSAGSCLVTVVPGCVACTTDGECDDVDACTTDVCAGSVCTHGVDPSCVATEICGDCADNDGDGLMDYEDDDCCAVGGGLEVRRMKLNPTQGTMRGNRMRMKVRHAPFDAARLDPATQDVTLQVSDGAGMVFCHTIAATNWTHRRRAFKFKDKAGAFAGGLRKGVFRMKKNGRIVFGTKGKRVLLPATSGQAMTVTLRVGEQCVQAQVGMRAHKRVSRGLVFP